MPGNPEGVPKGYPKEILEESPGKFTEGISGENPGKSWSKLKKESLSESPENFLTETQGEFPEKLRDKLLRMPREMRDSWKKSLEDL